MQLREINIKKSLSKAFIKMKPKREEIELFKKNFATLLNHINDKESEEFVKKHLMDFLKDTWYKDAYSIAPRGKTDFVIHTGKDAKHPSGILCEVKKPLNKADMVTKSNLNKKAMHELVLYYLRERVNIKNQDIRHLVITNIYEWFVFDAKVFEDTFYKNSKLVKAFSEWQAGQKVSSNTDFFYSEVVAPMISEIKSEITFTYFDIRDYEKPILNSDKADDNKLIFLYKILSPTHLLKLPSINDSNSLDKGFYAELLHIIGLEEIKDKSKKVIKRKAEGDRSSASLIENVIVKLDTDNNYHKLPNINSYGDSKEEKLFNIALELCITWINRILFLKLLEAQLIRYHKGDKPYKFLSYEKISDYDELYSLFFQVLARKTSDRADDIKAKYENIPYLNSSLFEQTELEDRTVRINGLDNNKELELYSGTVLKNEKNRPKAEKLKTLQYLFEFLDAYDFASEGEVEIQEENKTLINASILGLIFEKINGYKDGSFFTPSFITMYMSREAIRLAVLQKFKEKYPHAKFDNFVDLKNYISDHRTTEETLHFNLIINSLRICDPAVGSGHFLVSALNEIIAIKAELGILIDDKNVRITDYEFEVANDELVITNKDTQNPFEYKIVNGAISKDAKRLQKALFHEKQTIIENCLFGVDINPNSVKICRLRLWIELLKNAYYTDDTVFRELETLPNIDINIKVGNSLISRFDIDVDIRKALKNTDYTIEQYRNFVNQYKNTKDREAKGKLEQIINDIKNNFKTEIFRSDELKLETLKRELVKFLAQPELFELSKKQKESKKKTEEDLKNKIKRLNNKIEEIRSNKVYQNAFEWRFEFPEVLDNDGKFEGFDVMVGNPPYFILTDKTVEEGQFNYYKQNFTSIKKSYSKNIFALFIEMAIGLLKANYVNSFIVPEGLLKTRSYSDCVEIIESQGSILNVTYIEGMVFDEANIGNLIYFFGKALKIDKRNFFFDKNANLLELDVKEKPIITKILSASYPKLGELCTLFKGMAVADREKHLFNTKFEEAPDKFLLGNCIAKWSIHNQFFTNYNKLKIVGGTKIKSKYDKFPRILIRRTGNYLCCAYLTESALTESTLYSCWSNSTEIDNLFILGILHSKLINYYIKNTMVTNEQAFPQILMTDLELIPISQNSPQIQDAIATLANQILDTKNNNPQSDTTALENKIDTFVYQLYGLTEDEIKIVEASI